MPKILAGAFSGVVFLLCCGIALAYDCAPHCDYVHDYGPYDFSYVYPGLSGWPVCDREGNCSPYLVYRYSGPFRPGINIIVRPMHGAKPIHRSKSN